MAGVQGGDIIIKFAGQDIKNIYDYTYALGAIKIGEPVEMIVLREGTEVTITIVPEARK
jgi:S1-C subfamily serine protease